MLNILKNNPKIYVNLENKAGKLEAELRNNLLRHGIPGVINRIGSMMTLFFTEEQKVENFEQAMKSNTARYGSYFRKSLESGIYLAPSQFECLFVSDAHTDDDIDRFIEVNDRVLAGLAQSA